MVSNDFTKKKRVRSRERLVVTKHNKIQIMLKNFDEKFWREAWSGAGNLACLRVSKIRQLTEDDSLQKVATINY